MNKFLKRKPALENISDIIIENETRFGVNKETYKNLFTGKESDYISDITNGNITDGKYILAKTSRSSQDGFYAEYIKEEDTLIVYNMQINYHSRNRNEKAAWKIIGRIVFDRKNGVAYKKGCEEFASSAVDVTGFMCRRSVVGGRSTQILREFFGGYIEFIRSDCSYFTKASDITSMFYIWNNKEGAKDKHYFEHMMENYGEIDETIPDIFKRKVALMFKNHIINMPDEKYSLYLGHHFAYLQNTEKGYVARLFGCVLEGEVKDTNRLNIRYIEYGRIGINEETSGDIFAMQMLAVPLVFFDKEGLNDGFFKYQEFLLNRFANMFKKISTTKSRNYNDSFKQWYKSYTLANIIGLMGTSMYEKIMKSEYEPMKKQLVEYKLAKSGRDVDMWISAIYGNIDFEKGPLHQMLGIPLHMLKSIGNDKNIKDIGYIIKSIKTMFKSDTDYLRNMENKSVDSLLGLLRSNFGKKIILPSYLIDAVSLLCETFGAANVENYISFFLQQKQDYRLFYSYVNIINMLHKEIGGDYNWKLKGEALRRSHDSLTAVLDMCRNKSKYEKYVERYKKLYEEKWKNFEYECDKLMVKAPQTPLDVITEGTVLHHCAKGFVEPVGDNKTMLLFIRRKEAPDKPYYTLEIRDGGIRQCHGFGNCNTSNSEKVQAFLKRYCNKFGIRYKEGTDQLGV